MSIFVCNLIRSTPSEFKMAAYSFHEMSFEGVRSSDTSNHTSVTYLFHQSKHFWRTLLTDMSIRTQPIRTTMLDIKLGISFLMTEKSTIERFAHSFLILPWYYWMHLQCLNTYWFDHPEIIKPANIKWIKHIHRWEDTHLHSIMLLHLYPHTILFLNH